MYKHTNKGELIAWALSDKEELSKIIFTEKALKEMEIGKADLEKDMPLFYRSMPMFFDYFAQPEFIFLLREVTKDLIDRGTAIDSMSNDQVKTLVLSLAATQMQQMDFIKNFQKQKNLFQNLPKTVSLNRKMKRRLQKQL